MTQPTLDSPISAIRRGPAPIAVAILSVALIGAYAWWRIAAQYRGAEAFWAGPLAASADAYRGRVSVWLAARHEAGVTLAALVDSGGKLTDAFRVASGTVLGTNGVDAITVRTPRSNARCVRAARAVYCSAQKASRFSISSPEEAQRSRAMPDGRVLVPVVTAVAGGGALTQWVDPEVSLIPDLLRVAGSIQGATTTFVRRDGDVVRLAHSDETLTPLPSRRIDLAELPGLLRRPPLERELVRGPDVHGIDAIGVAAYLPHLRWHVYRSLPRKVAFAALRSEITTETLLAFALGSFVFGLLTWSLRERRLQQAKAALIQARLDSLQDQLRPHFLFNALNTIVTLVHETPNAAEAMLVRLADLLRLSLEESSHAMIPVYRELALLDAYLEVERIRFGDSLQVAIHVTVGANDLLVPRWVLQPLVENALKHGGAYARGSANISIAIRDCNGRLIIVVVDDGAGAGDGTVVEGVGLRNTRQRLQSLFGTDASITLRALETAGTEVVLELPARRDRSSRRSERPLRGVGLHPPWLLR